jgi:DNA-directed RNA polymerase specialized sigma24 family protein
VGAPAHDPARLAEVLRQGGEPAVAALLETHGVALYEYFRLMLGDETATIRALTDTVVAALAHVGQLRDPRRLRAWLLALARVNAHEFHPAGWDATAERYLGSLRGRLPAPDHGDDALAVITDAALLRMWPEEREIFIIGAPRYQVPAAELAGIFGLADEQQANALLAEAAGSFWRALERSAGDAGFLLTPDAARRAAALIGASPVSVSLSQILPFCTDPGLARLREDISSRVAGFGIDGFPVTFDLSWPGRDPLGAGQGAWPAGRTRDRKRTLLIAAAVTAVVAAVSIPLAVGAAIVFAGPPARGAPADAGTGGGSSVAAPATTQSSGPMSVSPSPAAATTSAAPARTTPAASRSSSPQPPRTFPPATPSPSPSGNKKSPSPSPSPTTPTPSPSPTRHGHGG